MNLLIHHLITSCLKYSAVNRTRNAYTVLQVSYFIYSKPLSIYVVIHCYAVIVLESVSIWQTSRIFLSCGYLQAYHQRHSASCDFLFCIKHSLISKKKSVCLLCNVTINKLTSWVTCYRTLQTMCLVLPRLIVLTLSERRFRRVAVTVGWNRECIFLVVTREGAMYVGTESRDA